MCIDYQGLMPLLMQRNTEEKLQHEAERLLQDRRQSAHTAELTPRRITKHSSSAALLQLLETFKFLSRILSFHPDVKIQV